MRQMPRQRRQNSRHEYLSGLSVCHTGQHCKYCDKRSAWLWLERQTRSWRKTPRPELCKASSLYSVDTSIRVCQLSNPNHWTEGAGSLIGCYNLGTSVHLMAWNDTTILVPSLPSAPRRIAQPVAARDWNMSQSFHVVQDDIDQCPILWIWELTKITLSIGDDIQHKPCVL